MTKVPYAKFSDTQEMMVGKDILDLVHLRQRLLELRCDITNEATQNAVRFSVTTDKGDIARLVIHKDSALSLVDLATTLLSYNSKTRRFKVRTYRDWSVGIDLALDYVIIEDESGEEIDWHEELDLIEFLQHASDSHFLEINWVTFSHFLNEIKINIPDFIDTFEWAGMVNWRFD